MKTSIPKQSRNAIIAWCMYDWANSGFPTVITTFIFATFFTQHIAANPIIGTAQWGNATALAGIIIAILGPIFGAIADYSGRIKNWLALFSMICITATAMLWFSYPHPSSVTYSLSCVVIATIGFEVAMVFYNALLPFVAPESHLGRVSGWAWGVGYVGGLACLLSTYWLFVKHQMLIAIGPFVGLWFIVFGWPVLVWVKANGHRQQINMPKAARQGITDLWRTIKTLPRHKTILYFLLSHMIYHDGLNALFAFGGIYAAGTFGLSVGQVFQLGIAMNITAGIGAIAFGWLDDWIGPKPAILIALAGLCSLGGGLLFVTQVKYFWMLVLPLGLFVGPVQAASRSLMAHIAPKQKANELFGLYAFSGKITAFMGPWLFGSLTLAYGNQRAGMAATLGLMLLGGLMLLLLVKLNKE